MEKRDESEAITKGKVEGIVGKVLRKKGYAAPKGIKELDAMFEAMKTTPSSEEFIKRVCAGVCGKKEYSMKVPQETIDRLKKEPVGDTQGRGVETEFRVAARHGGTLSDEERERLKADRRKLDEEFRKKKK